MDINKLKIELAIIWLLKPVASEAEIAVKQISKQLEIINKWKQQQPEWETYQQATFNQLKKLRKISNEFEDYKADLIENTPLEIVELSDSIKVKFDKKANVLIVYHPNKSPEVL